MTLIEWLSGSSKTMTDVSEATPFPVNPGGAVTVVPTITLKTVAAAATAEAITAGNTFFRVATILGNKDLVRTPNVGNVYVGFTSTNGQQSWKIEPGKTYEITAPLGTKYDLNDLYCDVENAGDGVHVTHSL